MNPEQIALIIIDIQRDFWQPIKRYHEFSSFPSNVGSLLSKSRSIRLTVVHIQSCFKRDRSDWMPFYRPHGRGDVPCIEGSEGVLPEEFAKPEPNEAVVTKQTFDGFVGTDLAKILDAHNVKGVLLAGLETSVCVLFTATSAYLRHFVPLVVSDACADEPTRHESTLRMYTDLCFKRVTTAHVRDDWASITDVVDKFGEK